MKAVGRVAVWTAFLLLVLAAISWAGIVLVAAYYFLVPAIALTVLIGFVAILSRAQRKPLHISSQQNIPARSRPNRVRRARSRRDRVS